MIATDMVLTLAGLLAIFVAMVLAAARLRQGHLDRRALLLTPGLWIANAAVVFAGKYLQTHLPVMADLGWNWPGKVLGIGVTLLCCLLLPDFDRKRAGLTWRQVPGSVLPALIVILIACSAEAIVHRMLETPDTRPETFLFQLFMPSLDEELFYRGLLAFYLARGLGDSLDPKGWRLDPSMWIITLQFSFAHAVNFKHGHPQFSVGVFFSVLYFAYLIGWVRQRTGSVVLPMVTHTLANTLFRLL